MAPICNKFRKGLFVRVTNLSGIGHLRIVNPEFSPKCKAYFFYMTHIRDICRIFATMTRQKIIDSAICVLNEDFSSPLDRIAQRAGLSRRTLHRYFEDRQTLLDACLDDMMATWQGAMLTACRSSSDPIEQLERMLYAGIDCGAKYAFLSKLRAGSSEIALPEGKEKITYERERDKWFSLVPKLQQQKIIDNTLSASWIRLLFTNMITTTIEASRSGDIAANDIKRLAWYSFSRSIGIS